MKIPLGLLLVSTGLLVGCESITLDKTAEPEVLNLTTGYSIGWSLNSISVEMQTQEASLLCKEMGGQLQVVDTRTSSSNSFDTLSTGDVQFNCFK